jgi:hypothetical protein
MDLSLSHEPLTDLFSDPVSQAAAVDVDEFERSGFLVGPMTVHGSYENRSDRPRRGIVLNFMRDGVRSNTNEPLLAGVPVIPMGQKIEGQFFPLLSKIE